MWTCPRKTSCNTVAFESLTRESLIIAAVFGIPPAIGMALATLRVTDGEAWLLATAVAFLVAVAIIAFILLLLIGGEPDGTHVQER